MKVESWQAWNPDAIIKSKIGDRLRVTYGKTNSTINHVKEINAEIESDFIDAFQNRISFVKDVQGSIDIDNISELIQNHENLKDNHELAILVTKYVFHHLKIHMELDDLDKEIEVTGFNYACENERIMYYMAKAGADVLGIDNGIEFWKKIVGLRLTGYRMEYEKLVKEGKLDGSKEITMIERSDRSIKQWSTIGLGNFTRKIMDDHKILYRFDKCVTHEVLKDLNDPEYAYISSCYMGDAPEHNFGHHYLRRTQTLHHGAFCDELYWDPRVHEDPEQPSLEFTKNL
ncbi:MAG: hypothetical protein RTV72_11985 [Candidatus Thorarchaeota archaeon]